jgi:hypothetical protein
VVEVNASDARSKSDNKATTGMAGEGPGNGSSHHGNLLLLLLLLWNLIPEQ